MKSAALYTIHTSPFTQPVGLHFPQTDLRHPQHNFAVFLFTVHINLALLSLFAFLNDQILIRIVKVKAKLLLVQLSFLEHELLSVQWRAET